jgi:hypothetical protein
MKDAVGVGGGTSLLMMYVTWLVGLIAGANAGRNDVGFRRVADIKTELYQIPPDVQQRFAAGSHESVEFVSIAAGSLARLAIDCAWFGIMMGINNSGWLAEWMFVLLAAAPVVAGTAVVAKRLRGVGVLGA